MHPYIKAKKEFGDLYRCHLDSSIITYRLLRWNEYLNYTEILESQVLSQAVVEETIFLDCVIDEVYKDSIDDLLAGEVLTIVNLILVQSGPSALEDIDSKLNEKRETVYSLNSQITAIICQAFPGYDPSQIKNMSWDSVIELFALAEDILIKEGRLKEPIEITKGSGNKQKQSIDIEADNRYLMQENLGEPPGDHNLHRARNK